MLFFLLFPSVSDVQGLWVVVEALCTVRMTCICC